jgi:hypothetical protein
MSVTFWIPGAPRVKVECDFCRDYGTPERHGGKCSPWCTGERLESTAPEANFSNYNAYGVLALLGLDTAEPCGSLAHKDIPKVLQQLMLVCETDRVSYLDQPPSNEGRVIYGGNTSEDTRRRLEAVRAVLDAAAKGGWEVVWG